MPNCLICKQPLGPEENNLSKQWHFKCEECIYCHESLAHCDTRIKLCIDSSIPPCHMSCHDGQKITEIKNHLIPVTQEHLQSLNNQILSFRSQKPSEETRLLLSSLLQDLHSCAANVSWILTLTKDKIRVEESQEYTEKIQKEVKVKREVEAVEQEKKNRLDAERKDPRLRDRRKAIEGLMKGFGISLDQATQMVDIQSLKAKQ